MGLVSKSGSCGKLLVGLVGKVWMGWGGLQETDGENGRELDLSSLRQL